MRDPEIAFRRRLAGLIAAVVVTVVACIGLAVSVERQANGTLKQLANVELEAALIVREFRSAVDELHGALLRMGGAEPEATRAIVLRCRERLTEWLRRRSVAVYGDEERQILGRLSNEARDYFAAVDEVAAGGFSQPLDHAAVVRLDDQVNRMQRIVDDFAVTEDTELKDLLQASLASILWLRNLVFACLALLLGALGFLIMFLYRDVVRPLKEQLVERDTLLAKREKLAALGTLAAGVAHEIRNPLTAIKGRLYMLRRSQTAAARREDEDAITQEVDRLERIVRDVLGYARPADPSPSVVELRSWLREFAGFIAPEIALHQLELVVEAPELARVHADPNQLRQVLLNLVRNAIEALEARPHGGVVTLALQCETASLHGQAMEVAVLTVTDNGLGVPRHLWERLFDPFFTTKENGTGLGLSIVARLVEKQAGEIRFRSVEGAGSRFAVYLPLHPQTSAVPP